MQIPHLYIKSFFVVCFLFFACNISAQVITSTSINAAYACATPGFNSYTVDFDVAGAFNNNNQFILELSDVNGAFNGNTITLATLSAIDGNTDITFSFPEIGDSYGSDQFKIRLRATSPQNIGPAIGPYEYHWFNVDPNNPFVLNNYLPVELCNGSSAVITVSQTNHSSYKWFKNNVLIPGETGPSLTVSQAGIYEAWVDLGICTENGNIFEAISNQISVTVLTNFSISISAPDTVDLCPGESYTLQPDVTNPNYFYTWYHNGTIVAGPSHNPSFTVDDPSESGNYYVEVENSTASCQAVSQTVSVNYLDDFSVTLNTGTSLMLLPGETLILDISTTASNPIIEWFLNNQLIPGETGLQLSVNAPGNYHAEVTENTTNCGSATINSPVVEVFEPLSFQVTIATNDSYAVCHLATVTLSITEIQGENPNGGWATVPPGNYAGFAFQWYKNSVLLNGETASVIGLASNSENGDYHLEVDYSGIMGSSNQVEVLIGLPDMEITTTNLILCDGLPTILSAPIENEYTYQWFKNGTMISGETNADMQTTEPGSYYCEISANGCSVDTNSLEIVNFNPGIVQISPEGPISIPPGGSQLLVASGAISYEWTDVSGTVLSTTNELLVTAAGTYFLTAFVENCSVHIEISVTENQSIVVPNVISINDDGINDRWVIPSKFAFQPDVEITIFSSTGEVLLQTKNYQNDWPQENNFRTKNAEVYYYLIRKGYEIIKKGALTLIK